MFILDYYLSTSNDAYTYHDIFTCKMLQLHNPRFKVSL